MNLKPVYMLYRFALVPSQNGKKKNNMGDTTVQNAWAEVKNFNDDLVLILRKCGRGTLAFSPVAEI